MRLMASSQHIHGTTAEGTAATRAARSLDRDLYGQLTPQHIINNPQFGPQAIQALQDARANWAAMMRAQTLEDAKFVGQLRAWGTGKGGNTDNALRQEISRIIRAGAPGFTPQEEEHLIETVRGGGVQQVLRRLGMLSPTGIVSASGVAALNHLLNVNHPLGLMALGEISRHATEARTAGRINTAQQATLARSPLYNHLLSQRATSLPLSAGTPYLQGAALQQNPWSAVSPVANQPWNQ